MSLPPRPPSNNTNNGSGIGITFQNQTSSGNQSSTPLVQVAVAVGDISSIMTPADILPTTHPRANAGGPQIDSDTYNSNSNGNNNNYNSNSHSYNNRGVGSGGGSGRKDGGPTLGDFAAQVQAKARAELRRGINTTSGVSLMDEGMDIDDDFDNYDDDGDGDDGELDPRYLFSLAYMKIGIDDSNRL